MYGMSCNTLYCGCKGLEVCVSVCVAVCVCVCVCVCGSVCSGTMGVLISVTSLADISASLGTLLLGTAGLDIISADCGSLPCDASFLGGSAVLKTLFEITSMCVCVCVCLGVTMCVSGVCVCVGVASVFFSFFTDTTAMTFLFTTLTGVCVCVCVRACACVCVIERICELKRLHCWSVCELMCVRAVCNAFLCSERI